MKILPKKHVFVVFPMVISCFFDQDLSTYVKARIYIVLLTIIFIMNFTMSASGTKQPLPLQTLPQVPRPSRRSTCPYPLPPHLINKPHPVRSSYPAWGIDFLGHKRHQIRQQPAQLFFLL